MNIFTKLRNCWNYISIFFYLLVTICILFLSGVLFGFEKYYTSELTALDAVLTDEIYTLNTHKITSQFDGKTVYAHGIVDANKTIIDPYFGIEVNGLVLICDIEYFQWVEGHSRKSRMPIYEQEWSSYPVAGENFISKKKNTLVNNYTEYRLYAKDTHLNAYNIDTSIVDNLPTKAKILEVEFTQDTLDAIQTHILEQAPQNEALSESVNDYYYFLQEGNMYPLVHIIEKNTVYIGLDPENPRIGDMQLRFTFIPKKQEVSFIAKQQENTLFLFEDIYGETATLLVQAGKKQIDDLIDGLQKEAFDMRVFLRIFCFLSFFFCFLILAPAIKRQCHKKRWARKSSWLLALMGALTLSILLILLAHAFIIIPRIW